MKPCIIMRSYNDMPLISHTLAMVSRQTIPFQLISLDNESTDGTSREIDRYTDHIVTIPRGAYIPGKVLNQGVEMSHGEFVVFLNSDCTPQNEEWLQNLLNGFTDDRVAAVFGRQIPRPDCHPIFARDTEDTYGDGSRQKYWRHCFSMASSAIRRSVWETMRFDETLQYSEDMDWTWRARQKGYQIRYVPDAIVMHSHNYTLRQFYRRHYGEGCAEAVIFDWSRWERSFFRYSLLPFIRQVIGDETYCLSHRYVGTCFYAPLLRLSQLLGRRVGFKDGLRKGAR